MTRQDIEARVREVLAETLGDEANTAPLERSLAGLGADSLDRLEITIGLEEVFQIELTDDEGERVNTVGDVITLIAGKTAVPA